MSEEMKNEIKLVDETFPNRLPLLITRGSVVFPLVAKMIYAQRHFSIAGYQKAIDEYQSNVIIATQKDSEKDSDFTLSDIYEVATSCKILSTSYGERSTQRIRLSGAMRVIIKDIELIDGVYYAIFEEYPDKVGSEFEEVKLITAMLQQIEKFGVNQILPTGENDFRMLVKSGADSLTLSYYVSDALNLNVDTKINLLSAETVNDRLYKLIGHIKEAAYNNEIEQKISEYLKESASKNQREYILREKMKAISKELGDDQATGESIQEKLKKNPYPQEVKDKVLNELKRMESMPQGSLEASLIKDYIDIVFDIPWFEETKDNDDISNVKKVLDEDHYGLKLVKERILEYLAVKQVNGNLKAPILCFFGPPGCGKTSLSMSIARALGRKFVKCSLGGISDEAEIRGHRRTYVGSRPGRIISLLRKAKVRNPVFLLDEIDKLGMDSYKGDPSSALLEVLDPEQNFSFNDNYLEISYDLSNVLFICTANDIHRIPEPLQDRLELIPVDSYTLLDKLYIAKGFLIKKEMKANGVSEDTVAFLDDGLTYIIERYTKESGVRDLERKIATILRKIIVDKLEGKIKKTKKKVTVGVKEVRKYLGVEMYEKTDKEKGSQIGVVTGLAYTPFGGDILPIEVTFFKGKGNLILTGKLGEVMKESCSIALDYLKANAEKYHISSKFFNEHDIHIHVPEGAVSKDGPSAGCAIATAMASAFTKTPVSGDIAMTGEVTLRGNALPIGGLREKTLAAVRSGIKKVIVPNGNKKDVDELPKEIKDNLEIIYMNKVDEAINICFKQ